MLLVVHFRRNLCLFVTLWIDCIRNLEEWAVTHLPVRGHASSPQFSCALQPRVSLTGLEFWGAFHGPSLLLAIQAVLDHPFPMSTCTC